jgi:hypothetical protein
MTMDDFSLEGKVAIVTGTASVNASQQRAADAAVSVVCTDINADGGCVMA